MTQPSHAIAKSDNAVAGGARRAAHPAGRCGRHEDDRRSVEDARRGVSPASIFAWMLSAGTTSLAVTGITEGASHDFTVAGAANAGTSTWNKFSSMTQEQFGSLTGQLWG